ncbi:MAG: GxxExxY protein [Lentisphaerae bacterium]|nr:GxxExxY protein [Lentisphaerota bacterium]
MVKLLFEDECYRVRGAVSEVYREIGSGFLEAVYQECMQKEMKKRALRYFEWVEDRSQ